MKSFVGILGAIVFGFGLIGYFLLTGGTFLPIISVHLILGLILIAFWLFGSGLKNVGKVSGAVKGRAAVYSYSAAVYILFFVGALAAINWLGQKHNHRFDLTEKGVFSLSQQTESAIENLKKPLKLVAFKNAEGLNVAASVEKLLELYQYTNSDKVKSEVIDPRTKPGLVEKYEMKQDNVIYLQYGEDTDPQKSVSRINEASEQALTNAILKLTRGAAKKIYVVEGHGEAKLSDSTETGLKALADAFKDENLTVEGIFLGEKSEVPSDAAAVLVVSPQGAIPTQEKDLLVKYADQGGRLLLFSDPGRPGDIAEIASKFGITVSQDVIIDLIQRPVGGSPVQIIVNNYGTHPVTRNLDSTNRTFFSMAASVEAPKQEKPNPDLSYSELVKSGPRSWAEKDLAKLFDPQDPSVEFNEGVDQKGPVALAIAYEKKLGQQSTEGNENFDKISRVVVFGDSDFILNASLGSVSNRDLVLNSINWLVGEEGGLTIRPPMFKSSLAPMTRAQVMSLLSTSLLAPELLLIIGLFVWWRRRTVA